MIKSMRNGMNRLSTKKRETLTAVLAPSKDGGFISYNPETGCTSQGETLEEAIANIKESVELYLEETHMHIAGRSLVTTFEAVHG